MLSRRRCCRCILLLYHVLPFDPSDFLRGVNTADSARQVDVHEHQSQRVSVRTEALHGRLARGGHIDAVVSRVQRARGDALCDAHILHQQNVEAAPS